MKFLNSSRILIWICCLFFSSGIMGQNVKYSLANPEQTFNGTDSLYEIDIMVSSLDAAGSFIMSSGQVYFNFNDAAFGQNIVGSNNVEVFYDSPDYLLNQKDNNLGVIAVYQAPNLNDNTANRFSVSWQQDRAGACISAQVTPTPQKLARLQLTYLPGLSAAEPLLCYETDILFRNQTYTACGPFDDCATLPVADCANFPPTNITVDSFSCDLGGGINTAPIANPDSYAVDEDASVVTDVHTNDVDAEETLTACAVTVVNQPGFGTLTTTPAPDCQITYTPDPDYNGSDMFAYEICDSENVCTMGMVSITVNPVNDLPTAADDEANTTEGTPVSIQVADNDTDVEDGTLSNCDVTITSNPSNGSVSIGAAPACDIIYTPDPGFCTTPCPPGAPVWADMQVLFADNNCSNAGCHGSNASGLDLTTYAGFSQGGDQCGNSIASGNKLAEIIMSGSTCGANTVPSMNTFAGGAIDATELALLQSWIDAGAPESCDASDSFVYQVCDSENACVTATVSVNVNCVNDDPVVNDDMASTDQGVAAVIDVLANDSDAESPLDPCNVTISTPPTNGTLTTGAAPGCELTYTPNAGYVGADNFVYTICDADGACGNGSVSITVVSVNQAPVAIDDNVQTNEDTPVAINVTANDTDDSPVDPCLVTISGQAANGTANVGAAPNCEVTYTPNANFSGNDSFEYTLCDSQGLCATAVVNVSVIGTINQPPVAEDDAATTDQDVAATIDVLANDSDAEGPLSACNVSITTQAGNGTATVGATPDCELTYTPNAGFFGTDTFAYDVCDNEGACDNAVVTVTVNEVIPAPVANDDAATTPFNTAIVLDASANDQDVAPCSFVVITAPANGTTGVSGCDITYTPNTGFSGIDTFAYEATTAGGTDQAVITITVDGSTNQPPTANADTEITDENTPVIIDVLANDSDDLDPTLDPCGVSVSSAPSLGLINFSPSPACMLTYTPNAGAVGTDTFEYQICDSGNACSTAVVTVTINAVSTITANDDDYTTDEDVSISIDMTSNDVTSNGTLSLCDATIIDGPTLGSLSSTSPAPNCNLFYDPNPGVSGTDTFSYEVCNVDNVCDQAVVTVTITPAANTAPVANDDNATTDEDTPVDVAVLVNDSDVEDGTLDPCNVTIVSNPANGSATVGTSAPCTLTYLPNPGFDGIDGFVYQVCDSENACSTASVTVQVIGSQPLQMAIDDAASTQEDVAVSIDLDANDVAGTGDNDPCGVTFPTPPSNGTVTLGATPDCDATYTPDPNFEGTDTFVYQICDAANDCSTATVSVEVTPVNDDPVANDDAFTTDGTATILDVAANDTDADGPLDPCTVSITAVPTNGTLIIISCVLTYTADANFNGIDTFAYEICDDQNACATATISVTTMIINDPPVANDDNATTDQDTSVDIDVLANDSDLQETLDPCNVSTVAGPSNGTISYGGAPGCVLSYQPNAGFTGTDNFTYQICDTNGLCDNAQVNITVAAAPGPIAVADIFSTQVDQQLMENVLTNDQGLLGGETTTVLATVSNGTLTLTTNGGVIYQPDAAFVGTDNFTYQVCNAANVCSNAMVTINVGFDPGIPTLSEWGLILLTLLMLSFATKYVQKLSPQMATSAGNVSMGNKTTFDASSFMKVLVGTVILGLVLVFVFQGFILPLDLVGTLVAAFLVAHRYSTSG